MAAPPAADAPAAAAAVPAPAAAARKRHTQEQVCRARVAVILEGLGPPPADLEGMQVGTAVPDPAVYAEIAQDLRVRIKQRDAVVRLRRIVTDGAAHAPGFAGLLQQHIVAPLGAVISSAPSDTRKEACSVAVTCCASAHDADQPELVHQFLPVLLEQSRDHGWKARWVSGRALLALVQHCHIGPAGVLLLVDGVKDGRAQVQQRACQALCWALLRQHQFKAQLHTEPQLLETIQRAVSTVLAHRNGNTHPVAQLLAFLLCDGDADRFRQLTDGADVEPLRAAYRQLSAAEQPGAEQGAHPTKRMRSEDPAGPELDGASDAHFPSRSGTPPSASRGRASIGEGTPQSSRDGGDDAEPLRGCTGRKRDRLALQSPAPAQCPSPAGRADMWAADSAADGAAAQGSALPDGASGRSASPAAAGGDWDQPWNSPAAGVAQHLAAGGESAQRMGSPAAGAAEPLAGAGRPAEGAAGGAREWDPPAAGPAEQPSVQLWDQPADQPAEQRGELSGCEQPAGHQPWAPPAEGAADPRPAAAGGTAGCAGGSVPFDDAERGHPLTRKEAERRTESVKAAAAAVRRRGEEAQGNYDRVCSAGLDVFRSAQELQRSVEHAEELLAEANDSRDSQKRQFALRANAVRVRARELEEQLEVLVPAAKRARTAEEALPAVRARHAALQEQAADLQRFEDPVFTVLDLGALDRGLTAAENGLRADAARSARAAAMQAQSTAAEASAAESARARAARAVSEERRNAAAAVRDTELEFSACRDWHHAAGDKHKHRAMLSTAAEKARVGCARLALRTALDAKHHELHVQAEQAEDALASLRTQEAREADRAAAAARDSQRASQSAAAALDAQPVRDGEAAVQQRKGAEQLAAERARAAQEAIEGQRQVVAQRLVQAQQGSAAAEAELRERRAAADAARAREAAAAQQRRDAREAVSAQEPRTVREAAEAQERRAVREAAARLERLVAQEAAARRTVKERKAAVRHIQDESARAEQRITDQCAADLARLSEEQAALTRGAQGPQAGDAQAREAQRTAAEVRAEADAALAKLKQRQQAELRRAHTAEADAASALRTVEENVAAARRRFAAQITAQLQELDDAPKREREELAAERLQLHLQRVRQEQVAAAALTRACAQEKAEADRLRTKAEWQEGDNSHRERRAAWRRPDPWRAAPPRLVAATTTAIATLEPRLSSAGVAAAAAAPQPRIPAAARAVGAPASAQRPSAPAAVAAGAPPAAAASARPRGSAGAPAAQRPGAPGGRL